ncbi:hypothetical protein EI42_05542 [Thermosporothrix hazakensis]|jgi:hypothetical protein|uniref:HAMP domain-containing protein n=1 Tax=Thermosporothrix hazakensis TaxID=644383 RepID=A0A326TZT1_THEHA|nr:hypothetical protein [Thermosporothrix hazakensis]PZW22408.1 hypothetical protein EI42_05542 [Thermosporothrix hazakensis]GCE49162.1 hypothetical protein KTH_40310 [Thermosporothrix hazakensis]
MDILLRLDTLGLVEVRYLRGRERYREWPQFELLAASRQARIFAYFNREVAEQLHQQILMVEAAVGLSEEGNDVSEKAEGASQEEARSEEDVKNSEKEATSFSPAFAQALKQLNELARQRLPEAGTSGTTTSGELTQDIDEEDDALEQLQDAFTQMMEVIRELAEELSTDALKLTSRFKCARTNIEFIPRPDTEAEDEEDLELGSEGGIVDIEVELVMVLQLFEEGRARPDDLPAVELQLDVDDFERLHETLDFALDREKHSRKRH